MLQYQSVTIKLEELSGLLFLVRNVLERAGTFLRMYGESTKLNNAFLYSSLQKLLNEPPQSMWFARTATSPSSLN